MNKNYLLWMTVLAVCLGGLAPATAAEKSDGPKPAALFKKLDKNSDGQVTLDEVGEGQKKYLKRLIRVGDTDKDGTLSRQEFLAATKPEPAPVTAKGENKKGKKGGRGKRDPKQIFKHLDKNGDGKVTKDEIPEKRRERFSRVFDRLGKDELTLEDFVKMSKRFGDGQRPDPEKIFARMDQDGSGKLTLAEVPERFKPRLEKMLKAAGKDSDGSINLNEFKRLARAKRGGKDGRDPKGDKGRRGGDRGRRFGGSPDGRRRGGPSFFRKLDTNKDHKLSKEELSKAASLIDELDKNGDGQLDPRELFGFGDRPEGMARRRGPQGKPGDRPKRPESQRGGRGEFAKRLVEKFDKDGDKKISKDEAPERMKKRFDKIDANSDGFITGQELKKARPQGGKKGKGQGKNKRGGKGKGPKKTDDA